MMTRSLRLSKKHFVGMPAAKSAGETARPAPQEPEPSAHSVETEAAGYVINPEKQELIEALKKQESGTAKTGGQGAEQMLGAMSGNTQTRYHALPRAARSALQRQTAMRSR